MSILLSAKRQQNRPGSAFEASLGMGVERERAGWNWLAWVGGLPTCLLLGMASNYGWHWLHNKPLEHKVEIRKETPLPFRVAAAQFQFDTVPLPAAPAPVVVQAPTPAPAAKPKRDPVDNLDLNGVAPGLAQRFMQAVQNSQNEQLASDNKPIVDQPSPQATPIAELPTSISARVPPLRYSSHVYSSTPANRIVSINGHDHHEGDEVAPGVVLLQIQPNYSIFRVGAQSFSLDSLVDWPGAKAQ